MPNFSTMPSFGLQAENQLIRAGTMSTLATKHLMGRLTEMYNNLSHLCRHLFAGTDIERNTLPPPVVDTDFSW